MGYIPLPIEETRWPQIARFVRGPLESLYFRDVHDLLRLPQREAGLAGGCNFAIARVLLSAVSSLSSALYATGAGDSGYHSAFCNMLVRFYPWETEDEAPQNEAQRQARAEVLWMEHRAALAQPLGLWSGAPAGGTRSALERGYLIRYRRLSGSDGNGLSESDLERLEGSADWPFEMFGETLQIRENAAAVLKLERFYWGVRQMILRLVADWVLAERAEASLGQPSEAG
ncbi:MAG TPA: hypothetical protein VFE34_07155 [Dongiaceae bacterium]|jgi:hypothetical protein|nr:hypothetical protein [Dongiaceae bacterium]